MTGARYPSLNGQPVLITGGATGIGADMVRAFHGQGARVGFLDLQAEAGAALAADLPGAEFVQADVTDIPALKAAINDIADRLGPIRVLVNNAASDKREAVDNIDPADWDLSQAINLRPQFFAAQAVKTGMAKAGGGSIINLSSIAWRLGHGDMTPYTTAKSAVIGLTKALADAFGAEKIRVNAIEPGAVLTKRQRALWFKTDEAVADLLSRQTLALEITGEDIAAMALFLASDEARAITGQSFIVDAGMA